MSTKEQAVIAELTSLAHEGYLTARELDWCVGAVRNRHGLTRTTRHQLRDTVQEIISRARERSLKRNAR
ncbi:hypothetical protein UFOVP1369_16 [uncultured Caudovirales phage]|uniref:Uncharacterized protein n=1 Tax=uncultured Caudovirales phage TaxID=2100421 RepID=A0A6J5S4W4_9CAUD|nr:hypothetical protein UFOVP1369_16 [uncultured Caudovirales phage]